MSDRAEKTVRIVNPLGFHARPAAAFVKLAGLYDADIELEKDGLTVNGKSIMGVLMLAAEQGSSLTIRGAGHDAETAVVALADLVQSGFEEE